LLGYLDYEGDKITEIPAEWKEMDDTSAWVIDDRRVVGKLDWSIGRTDSGMKEMLAQSDCAFEKDDMHLNWIHMFDRGRGYATSALAQKHKDWKDKGYKSVTLQPSFSFRKSEPYFDGTGIRKTGMTQKKLYSWYNDLGYKKSNLCAHDDECDSSSIVF